MGCAGEREKGSVGGAGGGERGSETEMGCSTLYLLLLFSCGNRPASGVVGKGDRKTKYKTMTTTETKHQNNKIQAKPSSAVYSGELQPVCPKLSIPQRVVVPRGAQAANPRSNSPGEVG